eukprot:TRINITY_DN22990_c0_g1_i1.p1 TRINITY_DN22990_c0_g1~~TRINITY_DN22990_c0_g1_i1.p1  ORF type:complete len:180 (-),score=49.92 TRINITY_DN22990_c0_g1_i1:166-705(-)
MNWTLLNETNPEDGVRLTYKGGSSCRKRNTPEVIKETNETWKDTERIFEIELECDRQLGADANSFITDLINSGATIQVEERSPPDECHYIMRWRSQYACPIQGVTLSSMGNTLFRWLFLAAVCAIVFALIINLGAFKRRYRQFSNGEFNGFADFVTHLISDISGSKPGRRSSKQSSHMI